MTLFEKIANRSIPASIVYEDDEIIGFLDIAPQAPVHVVIAPRRCISTLNDIAESDTVLLGRLMQAAKKIAFEKGIAEDGYRLVLNCNRDGGQSVDHIHIHLLGGRKMAWPPG